MKKNITLSVDIDTFLAVRSKIDNVSLAVNKFFEDIVSKGEPKENTPEGIEQNIKSIQNSINDLVIKKSVLELDLRLINERKLEEKKSLEEREKFKRWKCPVCKQLNPMDFERCSGKCGLKTRGDVKTEFIYIEK